VDLQADDVLVKIQLPLQVGDGEVDVAGEGVRVDAENGLGGRWIGHGLLD
jgi:hypothetical protein